jgi:hypothetical protein
MWSPPKADKFCWIFMEKLLKRKLSPEELRANRQLKPPESGQRPTGLFDIGPRQKERDEKIKKEEDTMQRISELVRKRPAEQEAIVIGGLAGRKEIEAIPGINEEFREKLLEIATLHERIEMLRNANRQFDQENKRLQKELDELKK